MYLLSKGQLLKHSHIIIVHLDLFYHDMYICFQVLKQDEQDEQDELT